MASRVLVRPPAFRSTGRSLLLTLPMALWSLLMFTPSFMHNGRDSRIGAAAVIVFMTTLFFLMMRTGKTYRWRRWFFVALGIPLSHRLHRRSDCAARDHEHSHRAHGFRRHAVLLHGDSHARGAGGADPGGSFSGIDFADGQQSALDRRDDRDLAGLHPCGGQGMVQLHLLLRRHRRRVCGDCQTGEDSEARSSAAAGAVGDFDLCRRAFRGSV